MALIYEDLSKHFNNFAFTPMNAEERAMPLTIQPVRHNVHREYAAELCAMALELKKQLAEENPTIRNRYNLSYSYYTLASLHNNQPEQHQFEKVVAYYEQEEAILQDLYAETRSISYATDLAICKRNLGDAWFTTGKKKDLWKAYDYYVEADRLRGTILNALPSKKHAREFAGARFLCAIALYAQKNQKYMEEVLKHLKLVERYWKTHGDDGFKNRAEILPFYLAATERALGIQPPAERADLTQTKAHSVYFAYAELLEILTFTDEDLVGRVPVAMMTIFRQYALPDYQPHLTWRIPLEDQEISKRTAALLANLSMSVWCSGQDERDELGAILEENDRLKREEEANAQT